MLAISVELLHGTFRADPDGTAGTGGLTRAEWPPGPSRLLAAMVAADGTRERCRVTDGSELEWFEQLPAPVIHAHGTPWHQPLQPRYVVLHKGSAEKQTHQEYVGRKVAEIRPGVRVTPRYPHVVYSWDTETPPNIVDALRRRAARIGYLGAADSPVRVRVGTRMPSHPATGEAFRPDPARGHEDQHTRRRATSVSWTRCTPSGSNAEPTLLAPSFQPFAIRHRTVLRRLPLPTIPPGR